MNAATQYFRAHASMHEPFLIPHRLQRFFGYRAQRTGYIRGAESPEPDLCSGCRVGISGIEWRAQSEQRGE